MNKKYFTDSTSSPKIISLCAKLGILIVLAYSFGQCRKSTQAEAYTPPQASKLSGAELAKSYCASCHAYPDPGLLDKNTWQNDVLPKMYTRLGLGQDIFDILSKLDIDEMTYVAAAGVYPEHPMLAQEDWKKIVDFYIKAAPEKLSQPSLPTTKTIHGFDLIKSAVIKDMPSITMVYFDTLHKQIYAGIRGNSHHLVRYSLALKALDSSKITSPITDISIMGENQYRTLVGKMDPNDRRLGKFIVANSKAENELIDSLQRPVQTSFADLNQDGSKDAILCEFGNELGKLQWFDIKNKKSHIINYLPGARNSIVDDLNNDGKPDILVLMTQAREQILLYLNKGGGNFEEINILNFPPVWGSSYISLADMDGDGLKDIVHTAGDNADLSPILKPYHGIRIFKNMGGLLFKQSYFYPMHGASKAMVADFNKDNKPDIAAISFFIDFSAKNYNGFVLLLQGPANTFEASTHEQLKFGKWMVMDVNDADKDGDQDILLGSFLGKGLRLNDELKQKKNIELVLLKNQNP